jgi:hypothetical protein
MLFASQVYRTVANKGFSMKKVVELTALLLCAGVLAARMASAGVIIDFEGASGSVGVLGGFLDFGEYRFTVSGGATPGAIITNQSNIGVPGDTSLFALNNTEVTLSRVDSTLFDLLSFDIAGSFQGEPDRYASLVTATGGGTSVAGVPLDGVYTSVEANLFAVSAVSFVPTGNVGGGVNNFEFTLDNLSVRPSSVVSAPASIALLGLGLAGLGWKRRKA